MVKKVLKVLMLKNDYRPQSYVFLKICANFIMLFYLKYVAKHK